MITVNADAHPLMKRFHRPGSEKRSVVIVPRAEYESWLAWRNTDEAYSFLRLYPADAMHAEPYPLPPRTAKAGAKGTKATAGTAAPNAQASFLADG